MRVKGKLTSQQKIFADEYLIDLNGTRAYRVAYPSCKSDEVAAASASRLLRNDKVAAYLAKAQKAREQRTEITQDRVLLEYARLGFLDPRKLFNADGSPKGIQELDDDTAAAIAGLDVMEIYSGSGDDRTFVGYLKKYKMADKRSALDSIGKHLGMFKEKNELDVNIAGKVMVLGSTTQCTDQEIQDLLDSPEAAEVLDDENEPSG